MTAELALVPPHALFALLRLSEASRSSMLLRRVRIYALVATQKVASVGSSACPKKSAGGMSDVWNNATVVTAMARLEARHPGTDEVHAPSHTSASTGSTSLMSLFLGLAVSGRPVSCF